MPRWNQGLVNAFPVPEDHKLSKNKYRKDRVGDGSAAAAGEAEAAKQEEQVEIPWNTDPFLFFSLPAELRNRVYNFVLFSKPPYRAHNGGMKGSRIAILLASKQFHKEASYALYTTHKFLIFPIQEFEALPTILELPLYYRILVTNLTMAVGESWTNPPKSWRVGKKLARCLANLKNIQTLSVFVHLDPSHPSLKMHRISYEFYTDFCGDLLEDVLEAMSRLKYVQLDGNPSVDVHGPLVSRLRQEAANQDKMVTWGKNANWAHTVLQDAGSDHTFSLMQENLDLPKDWFRAHVPVPITYAPPVSNTVELPGLQNALLEHVRNMHI